ncbi:RHS repeat domain-containing protein [Bacteroides intestinalis]|uniref:RHS repeat domain-containing protein n=1 Tax=Bacteroides intestinalis TaxID=329854 RepID=UPI00216AED74|nr:RHS repeat-associated core domain-containing protein [Bacteroides intestinalis]
MKRIYLLYLLLLLQATAGHAQDSSQNYILTRTMLKSDTKSYLSKVVYYDGLGRPFQTVNKAIENTNKKGVSLATLQEYDAAGRETKTWLPAVITPDYLAPASFKSSAPASHGNDSRPYQEAVYETSPQNRIVKQYGAGADWHSGHPVATEFMGNSATAQLRCTRYKVTSAGALEASGDYANGTLNVTRTTDEDGNMSYTFMDKIGRTLLERRMNGSEALDTYYVYDNYGNLCYVLPPAINGNISTDNLNLYAYQYNYDGCNRCIRKKLPGTQYIEYVYDNSDRLTFSQDGSQRALSAQNWTYYKYDQLNRLTEQGLCTNKVTTSGTTVHIMNYYDSYSFIGTQGFTGSNFSTDTSGYGKGALTGQMVAGINGNPVWKAFYYDIRGREVKRVESNAMNGYDVTTTSYSFTNKPLTLTHVHTSGSKSLTEVHTYSYDYADRLSKVQHKLDNNTIVTLAEYTYDDLGRMEQKKLGGTAHSSTYSYNIRSWLTGITGSKFTQTLAYNNSTAGYNGNITAMGWTADGDSHSYTFTYDGLSRLLNATHGAGRFTEKVTSYDKNGNIKGLQRYGQTGASTYGLIDNLSYTLNGNQLNRVDDAVNASAYNGGFEFKDAVKQANEYAYDNNGNLTKDLNKGIEEIQYNSLNLPKLIKFKDQSTITYTYAADGTKLRVEHKIGNSTTQTTYCSNVIYEGSIAKCLLTEEGYVSLDNGEYYYYLKDHQGNNWVVVDQNSNVEETNHYYPFGGVFTNTRNAQPYKYNGKELDTKKGLNWYDYGARMYDAALGRWHVVDPLAEKYYSVSPYNYCMNNPVNAIDSNGEKIVFVNGFLGFGSPTGGSAYWGGTNSSFVRGAQAFLQDKSTYFANIEYNYWRSSTFLRNLDGYNYAKENYSQLINGMNSKDVFHFVSHSMGGAFSEGMIRYLEEQGWTVNTVFHLNAWQPTELYGVKGPLRVDATITNDWVQGLSLPISGNRDIPNADYKIRKKSTKEWKSIHRDLIDDGDFWNINNEMSWNDAMSLIQKWIQQNPNIKVNGN